MNILPLLLTVFIDSIGFGLVFPIFSPLIMQPESEMLSPEVSIAMRGLLFGFLVCSYGLGQFFGGPLLGSLSDRLGRKRVLVGSMWLAFVSYFLAGFGIIVHSLLVLFVARLFCGISAGSFTVAQSVVSDNSTKENRAKNFGMVGTALWVGFVIGPYIGGKLASFGYTIPFSVASLLCLLNALLLLFCLKETLPKARPVKIGWFKGLSQLNKAFRTPALRGLFSVMFLFCLGWGVFTEFSPIFLIRKFGTNVEEIANFYAWVGLWIAICQGILIRPLLQKLAPEKLLRFGLIAMGLTLPILLFVDTTAKIFWVIPVIAFAQALTFPTSATIASSLAAPSQQGEILGIHNSVQWAAISIPPLFSGSLFALYPHLPITIGSICMVGAFCLYLRIGRTAISDENNLE